MSEPALPPNRPRPDPPHVSRVRDLTESDLGWLAQQERQIFGDAAWSEALIREDWRYGTQRYRGVELAGELVAYAVYGFEGDAFHLVNLAVTPGHRRAGVATVLMDDFLGEARRFAVREVWLEVAVTNTAARALYEAHDFEFVRVRRRYYQPGDIDGLVMRRRMSSEEAVADAR